eukprot:TRINITY_DN7993_c0_g1_i1.p1 TRINITY_DN7993_c0_g1~~TRINITY_DN7993_c0_g1_i1.p1  ORF type:complete len:584 (-),score=126.09 TRINITY_DN7993_c0_g1_i1:315-2066(-)
MAKREAEEPEIQFLKRPKYEPGRGIPGLADSGDNEYLDLLPDASDIEQAIHTWKYHKRGPFRRAFYNPQDESLEDPGVAAGLREEWQISIEDDPYGDCPAPIRAFSNLKCLPTFLVENLEYNGFSAPMPIQSQALPLVMSGKNVIGLAQTGSGKTLAFLLPAIVHIEAQTPLRTSKLPPVTPIALVLAPTRELAVQISDEAQKVLFNSETGKHVTSKGVNAVVVYGGGNKRQQQEKLFEGPHILVATPGRLLDFLEQKTISLMRTTYFVLDEADRMLDMGFSPDVSRISRLIRPERQVLFFSATWAREVQELAAGLCEPQCPPVRISFGQNRDDGGDPDAPGMPREEIEQEVMVVDEPEHDGSGMDQWMRQDLLKRELLEAHLVKVLKESQQNKILVFVNQKTIADELAFKLSRQGFAADAMHGSKSQEARLWVLDQFKSDKLRLLVATDVLGRGIDIPSITHVVIHEMCAITDYVHRIGRTGRGIDGTGHALVFFEYYDKHPELAGELIKVLEASNQKVPPALQRIATEVAAGIRMNSEDKKKANYDKKGWTSNGKWNKASGSSWNSSSWSGGGGGWNESSW